MQFESIQDVALKELESQLVIWRKMVTISIRFAIAKKKCTQVTKFETDMPINDPWSPLQYSRNKYGDIKILGKELINKNTFFSENPSIM